MWLQLNLFCLSSLTLVIVKLQHTKYHHLIHILTIKELIFFKIQQHLLKILIINK